MGGVGKGAGEWGDGGQWGLPWWHSSLVVNLHESSLAQPLNTLFSLEFKILAKNMRSTAGALLRESFCLRVTKPLCVILSRLKAGGSSRARPSFPAPHDFFFDRIKRV